MKRPIPKAVRVGPLRWRISTSLADFHGFAESENDTAAMGFTNLQSLTISLRPNMPLSLQQEVLLHELLHAIIATIGGVFPTAKGSELEEAAVSQISPMLLSVLRANEEVLEFILGD